MKFDNGLTYLLCAVSLVLLTSCSYIQNSRPYTAISDWVYADSRPENIKQQRTSAYNLEDALNSYVGKSPNELYKDLGDPTDYKVVVNSDDQIIGARIIYEYIYNFATKQNDCTITFHTDATQSVIKPVDYN
jgi:hypothetical protein